MTGNPEVAQELIDNGADVNLPDIENKTPLMQATINNHHHLVKVEYILQLSYRLYLYTMNAFHYITVLGVTGGGGGSRRKE